MTVLQRTPDLGLTLRMQRTAAPAPAPVAGPPAPAGGVLCSGWLIPWLCNAPEDNIDASEAPGGGWTIRGLGYDSATDVDYESGLMSSHWVGTPAQLNGSGQPRPIPSMGAAPVGFACLQLKVNTTYYFPFPGRHFMALAAPGGTWTAEWDSAPGDPLVAASGHRVRIVGSTLTVQLRDTDTGINAEETLVARAYDGTTLIAELQLIAVRFAA